MPTSIWERRKNPRRYGEKNAQKALDALKNARELPLERWLIAFGIPQIGEVVAKALADTHPDLDHVAESPYIRDIIRLDELVESALKANPNTRENRKAVREGTLSAEEAQQRYKELTDEIDALTGPYLETGYLRKNTGKLSYGSEIGVAARQIPQQLLHLRRRPSYAGRSPQAGNQSTVPVIQGQPSGNPGRHPVRQNLCHHRHAQPAAGPL